MTRLQLSRIVAVAFVALFTLASDARALEAMSRFTQDQRTGDASVGDTTKVITSPRTAADSALEARTSSVASQLRCPVCQGLSIQDSPSELSQSMRAVVREQLAAGRTPDQVKAYFVGRYGEWILLSPEPKGFNLVAYLLPVGAVLLGGTIIAIAVRRWTSTSVPVAPGADER